MNLTNEDIKNFKDKKYKKQNHLFVVEGNKFCQDLIDCGVEIVYTITYDKDLTGFPNIEVVSEKMFNSLSTTKTPQSVICVCKIKEFDLSAAGNSLILDNLQDPGNVGTLVRSAIAFGFEDIFLIDGADPYSEKVIRSSAGTILKARLHICSFDDIRQHKNLIADNFIVADMFGQSIDKIQLPKSRLAVIIGNEGQGVSEKFKQFADTQIKIPMSPKVESLNAGVAGSIIMQKLGEI